MFQLGTYRKDDDNDDNDDHDERHRQGGGRR
jgi:hypothetical protein